MSQYFTLKEMCESETAKKYGIDNTPSASVITHLNELMNFLDELRIAWGSAIIVTSGYRCHYLNQKVGGSSTSVHKRGWAADLKPKNGKIEEFKKFCADWIKDKNWDQLLLEKNKNGSEWVHIGLYSNSGQQRKQIKIMNI